VCQTAIGSTHTTVEIANRTVSNNYVTNISNLYVVEGYSLQLIPRISHPKASKYEGEWMSELLSVTGNVLCVTLSISVPKQFDILVQLYSLASTKTVYEASNATSRNSAMDLFSVFEVQLSDVDRVQLVVYVSLYVTINAVNMNVGNCPNNSMYRHFLQCLKVTKVSQACFV